MTACRDGLMTCNTAKIYRGQNLLERIICTGRVVDLSLQNPWASGSVGLGWLGGSAQDVF